MYSEILDFHNLENNTGVAGGQEVEMGTIPSGSSMLAGGAQA